jgi:hypothetical protein
MSACMNYEFKSCIIWLRIHTTVNEIYLITRTANKGNHIVSIINLTHNVITQRQWLVHLYVYLALWNPRLNYASN